MCYLVQLWKNLNLSRQDGGWDLPGIVRSNGSVRNISSDADALEDSYEEWLSLAERKLQELSFSGLQVEKVDVHSEQLILWCNERALEVNAQSRSRYAAEKLQELHGDQS